jgi:hypothetical protein
MLEAFGAGFTWGSVLLKFWDVKITRFMHKVSQNPSAPFISKKYLQGLP